MVTFALVLGVAGFMLSVVAIICVGLYLAWRKPKQEEALPDGVYRLKFLKRDRVTGAPQYEVEDVENSKESDAEQATIKTSK